MALHSVTGWRLDEAERAELLARFKPLFPDVIADHVTLCMGAGKGTGQPVEQDGSIVGEIDDGAGLQALVVSIGGTTDRWDGSSYHITWSLDRSLGRRPAESSAMIARLGWRELAEPVPIRLHPAKF